MYGHPSHLSLQRPAHNALFSVRRHIGVRHMLQVPAFMNSMGTINLMYFCYYSSISLILAASMEEKMTFGKLCDKGVKRGNERTPCVALVKSALCSTLDQIG